MERERLPESAAYVLAHLHWVGATDETRNDEGAELEDEGAGDFLLSHEFLQVNTTAFQEMRFAQKANSYKMSVGDPLFCPLFNDMELYSFVGSLYLARHFADPLNRSFFLSSNQAFNETQLLKLVRRCNISEAKPVLSTSLLKLMNKILETKYITHQPAKYTPENEHLSPLLKLLRERQRALAAITDAETVLHARVVVEHFRKMEEEVVNLYKMAKLGPRRHLSEFERCRIEQAFTLTEAEATRLLAAARVNGFFYDLISRKPPQSKSISHEQALFECAEHARLWLFNSRLRVYYNFPLTYCDLAKGAPTSKELEAWNSPVGYQVLLPSFEEKLMRREALAIHWDELENLPEDRDPGPRKLPKLDRDSMTRIELHDVPEKFEALEKFFLDEKRGVTVSVPAQAPTVKRRPEQNGTRKCNGEQAVDALNEFVDPDQLTGKQAAKKRNRCNSSSSSKEAEQV